MRKPLLHFTTDVMPIERGVIVSLQGELDANSSVMASTVLENLVESGVDYLLLDCNKLTYISSAGIGVILSLYHLCLLRHTYLMLYGMQPKIMNVLEVLGADKILHIANCREDAMAYTLASRRA
jgi:anti-anti-sigma factor